jgi:nucleoid DNA-binding protein
MATRKAAPKKAAAKAKPAAPAAPKRKTTAISEKMTKTQILTEIAENANLSRKQVGDVLVELEALIERSIKKRALGEFTIPGLMKITTVKKPATKARKGINPFTGEETMFKAKPASVAVKVRPLKKLKDYAV